MIAPAFYLLSAVGMTVAITSLALSAWNAQAKDIRMAQGWANLAVNCSLSASLAGLAGLVATIARL